MGFPIHPGKYLNTNLGPRMNSDLQPRSVINGIQNMINWMLKSMGRALAKVACKCEDEVQSRVFFGLESLREAGVGL
jgi:hypothetical protein